MRRIARRAAAVFLHLPEVEKQLPELQKSQGIVEHKLAQLRLGINESLDRLEKASPRRH